LFSRRTIWIVALASLLVSLPALASATGPTTSSHPVKLTIKQASIQTSGTAGSPGYTETDAQLDSGTPGGSGAGTITIIYGTGAAFTAKTTIFSVSGTIRVNLSGAYALGAAGYTVTGTGTITGGTGRYKGATGKVSFMGGQTVSSTVRTIVVKGKIRY
jgi:hypothetical protein